MDCQISCQASGYVDCKADLQGGCEIACQSPDGALFCDGQYVDTGGNLQECIAALQALLNIEVDVSAYAQCSGNTCEAGVDAKCSACAVAPTSNSAWSGYSLAALGLGLGLAGLRRRRRRA
jgi:MYXO-CTERM domain-containing protein